MRLRFAIFAFLGLAAALTAFFFVGSSPKEDIAASFSGFTPGARVAYKIAPVRKDQQITGEEIINANGELEIPYSKLSALATPPVTYNFSVMEKEGADPVNIFLAFDADKEKISVLGDGFDDFSNISMKSQSGANELKADWAGIFKGESAWKEKDGSFKIAFFENNLANDAPKNPRIIEIFLAPGGGGPPLPFPTPRPDLNGYTNLHCETVLGARVPSTCRPDTLAPTIIPSGPGSTPMQRASYNVMTNYVVALMMMTEQLSDVMIQHTFILGPFLDAKHQLETQQLIQKMNAKAHKDYHPGELMCQFGSFIKSVPQAEQKMSLTKRGLNSILMSAYSNLENMAGAEGYAIDVEARIRQFRSVYCDPFDNNNGLAYMCEHDQDRDIAAPIGSTTPNRMNKDIEYARTMEMPLTMNLNYADGTSTPDEEDVYALARNLYWPRVLDPGPHWEITDDFREFLDARKIFAITNVAHNSYLHIAAMKAQTDEGLGANAGWNFMKSLMRNFGLSDPDIEEFLGEYPSYYAQMEVLTKKIYQNPDFYTNVMDTPTNVKRIGVSMDAIRVMQQRDMMESLHRQEMINSMMVEEELAPEIERINSGITSSIKNMSPQ